MNKIDLAVVVVHAVAITLIGVVATDIMQYDDPTPHAYVSWVDDVADSLVEAAEVASIPGQTIADTLVPLDPVKFVTEATASVYLTMASTKNCGPCKAWVANEMGRVACKTEITEYITPPSNVKLYPTFFLWVSKNNTWVQVKKWEGYTSAGVINSEIKTQSP